MRRRQGTRGRSGAAGSAGKRRATRLQNDPTKIVEVCVACDESRGLLIVIRDPGPGFDPAAIPSPVVGQNLLSTHGRGIFLINQLMDEVHFEKGGTEIHMKIT